MLKLNLLLIAIFFILIINAQVPIRDVTFSFDGHVRTPIGTNNEYVRTVLVQPDNKIIATGHQTDHPTFGPQRFALVRYLYNGDLDTAFGVNGKVTTAFQSQNWCLSSALQTDGKIVAAGQSSTGFCIARYTTNGSIDSTFGTNGYTVLASSGGSSSISSICILTDGSILALGSAQVPSTSNFELKLVKFTANGFLDTSFGNSGVVLPGFAYESVSPSKILVQPNGEIIVAGKFTYTLSTVTVNIGFLAKFTANGSINTSFGNNGISTTNTMLGINDLALDINNKFVAVGNIGTNAQGTTGDVSVARFNNDGSIDTTFAQNGSRSVSVDSYAEYANAVLVQPDGKILLGGSFFNFVGGTVTDCLIIRFTSDGDLDPSFGTNGVFKTGVCSGTDAISAMAFDSDFKLIVGGQGNYGSNFDFIVGRLTLDEALSVVKSESTIPEFTIYPNPAKNLLNIKSNNTILSFQLFDLNGKLLLTQDIQNKIYSIDTSNLIPGSYILKLNTINDVISKKLIIH